MRPGIGLSVMPVATPSVPFAPKVSSVGLAGGLPDNGFSWKKRYGGFSVKLTDEGDEKEPDRGCETVTEFVAGSVSATVVPGATEDPVTAMPTVTPLTSAKCRTRRGSAAVCGWPSLVVAGELVSREKENTGAFAGLSPAGYGPMKYTTVPAGT